MSSNPFVVFVTAPTQNSALSLSRSLVKSKLVACVNIIPKIISVYEWQEKINQDDEALMVIKTTESSLPKVTETISSNHPYEVPEIISWPITHGSDPYLKWIQNTVKPQ